MTWQVPVPCQGVVCSPPNKKKANILSPSALLRSIRFDYRACWWRHCLYSLALSKMCVCVWRQQYRSSSSVSWSRWRSCWKKSIFQQTNRWWKYYRFLLLPLIMPSMTADVPDTKWNWFRHYICNCYQIVWYIYIYLLLFSTIGCLLVIIAFLSLALPLSSATNGLHLPQFKTISQYQYYNA